MDNFSKILCIEPLNENQLNQQRIEIEHILKFSTKNPIKYGKMKNEIKKAISNTLLGHKVSDLTKRKISKTISKRNSEKVCGFALGHSSKAGSIGGKSKSVKKINAVKISQQKSLETIKGSVWMFNEEKRSRVPKHLVQQKILEGWKTGFRK